MLLRVLGSGIRKLKIQHPVPGIWYWKANIERRTPNIERPIRQFHFDIRCSMFRVRRSAFVCAKAAPHACERQQKVLQGGA